MSYSTGWWGIPGDLSGHRSTKTHIASKGRPLCGVHLGRRMVFQFCASSVAINSVECLHCRKRWAAQLEKLAGDSRDWNRNNQRWRDAGL